MGTYINIGNAGFQSARNSEYEPGTKEMDLYIDWLRRMFKSGDAVRVFAGVYMTGILPIKKYKTQSALNNFTEYSMVNPGRLAGYFGFTRPEVQQLCKKYNMDFGDFEKWYDGYRLGKETSIFNPNSVIQAIYKDWCAKVLQPINMNWSAIDD